MVIKSTNDSVRSDGRVPRLLVFESIHRLELPVDPLMPSILQPTVAVGKGTEIMSLLFAKRKIQNVLYARNSPDVSDVHKAAIGSPVLVYRQEKYMWGGPFSLLDIHCEDVYVMLPPLSGPKKFRFTTVRPYIANDSPSEVTFSETDNLPVTHVTISG